MVRKRDRYTRARDRRRVRPKTPAPTTGWLKAELSALAHVSPRRITDYVQRKLLPAPVFRGTATRYQRVHLLRLLAIERLQAEGMRELAKIRKRLNTLSEPALEAWVANGPLRDDVRVALRLSPPSPSAQPQSNVPKEIATHATHATAHPSPAERLRTAPGLSSFPTATWHVVQFLPGLHLAIDSSASPLVKAVASQVQARLARTVAEAFAKLDAEAGPGRQNVVVASTPQPDPAPMPRGSEVNSR